MKKFYFLFLLFIPFIFAITGCDDNTTVVEVIAVEDICDDGLDNDEDGLIDGDDSDCDPIITEVEIICNDGVDNDQDMFVDCADEDCDGTVIGTDDEGNNVACEFTEVSCNDGIDNDMDTFIDCADEDCDGSVISTDDGMAAACEFGNEISCSDGEDNDADGATDTEDADCGGVDIDSESLRAEFQGSENPQPGEVLNIRGFADVANADDCFVEADNLLITALDDPTMDVTEIPPSDSDSGLGLIIDGEILDGTFRTDLIETGSLGFGEGIMFPLINTYLISGTLTCTNSVDTDDFPFDMIEIEKGIFAG